MLYKARKVVIKVFGDCFSVISEAKCKRIHEEGVKILIPRQMLQRLPITLAQVKASNT